MRVRIEVRVVGLELVLQIRDRFGSLVPSRQHIRLHLDRGTERGRQVCVPVERHFLHLGDAQIVGLTGVLLRLIVVFQGEFAAAHPAQRLEPFGSCPARASIRLEHLRAAAKIVVRDGVAHTVDQIWRRGQNSGSKQGENVESHLRSLYIEDNKYPPSTTSVWPVRYDDPLTRQHQRHFCNLYGLAQMLDRLRAKLFSTPLVILPVIFAQRGLDQSRRDRVHAHAAAVPVLPRSTASS